LQKSASGPLSQPLGIVREKQKLCQPGKAGSVPTLPLSVKYRNRAKSPFWNHFFLKIFLTAGGPFSQSPPIQLNSSNKPNKKIRGWYFFL
jgi:hypothetical protein